MLNLIIIVGSTREGRFSEKLLPWLKANLAKRKNLSIEVLDLREYPLPLYNQPHIPSSITDGNYKDTAVNTWAKKIADGDAYIFIAPEYNYGYSAVLKNALDSVFAEWNNKMVGLVSYGGVGGARSTEQLRQVITALQMASTRVAVHIQSPRNLLETNGDLKEGALDSYSDTLNTMLDQLTWWGDALKEARSSRNDY